MSPDTHRPVVVGVSGADDTTALTYAVHEARRRATSLRLVHVAPAYVPVPTLPLAPDSYTELGHRLLQRARDAVGTIDPGLEVARVLRTGSRAYGLARETLDAQLLVVGRRRHGGTAGRVCARASCPVVVVPDDWAPSTAHGQRVVLGVRAGTPGGAVLGEVFARVASLGGTVEAVHAWHVPDPYVDLVQGRAYDDAWTLEGTRLVEGVVAEARAAFPQVPVEVRVIHGRPVQVLQDEAATADLLVLQRRPHALLPHGHLGWTARSLVASSSVPVMVLPVAVVDEPDLVLEEAGALKR